MPNGHGYGPIGNDYDENTKNNIKSSIDVNWSEESLLIEIEDYKHRVSFYKEILDHTVLQLEKVKIKNKKLSDEYGSIE